MCSNAVEMRDKYKDAFVKKHGVKLGFMSPFIKASAFALQDQPTVNAVIEGTEIIYRDYVDISVAVATPKVTALCCLFCDVHKQENNYCGSGRVIHCCGSLKLKDW